MVQCVAVEEVPEVVVEVLREAGEDSVTVAAGEAVGAAEVEEVDSVLAGPVVEDEVEIPTSLDLAVSEGVGHSPYMRRYGALWGNTCSDNVENQISSQSGNFITVAVEWQLYCSDYQVQTSLSKERGEVADRSCDFAKGPHHQLLQGSRSFSSKLSTYTTICLYRAESRPRDLLSSMAAPQMKLDPKYDDYDYPTMSPTVQSGHPGHTTPEQDAQVHQLRMQLESAGYTERLDTLSMVVFHIPRFLNCSKLNLWP